MSIESNSHSNESHDRDSVLENQLSSEDYEDNSESSLSVNGNKGQEVNKALAALKLEQDRENRGISEQNRETQEQASSIYKNASSLNVLKPKAIVIALLAITVTVIGIALDSLIIGILGILVTLLLSGTILLPWFKIVLTEWLTPQQRSLTIALTGLVVAGIAIIQFSDIPINWDASGTLAEWFGALGQILIAIIAVYVAWRQYVISKDLTIQQNLLTVQQNNITQQQTIDSYFQGISDLVLDDEGLLEDWPQERLLAEGRTAAILGSVDAQGKAKIIRFLSQSKLLTPLQRDSHLGRAIFDGKGGYAEDRYYGVRVIDLGVMLAGADLSHNDLRWTDLSEANFVRTNLSNCDLVKANLARCILYEANLSGSDLNCIRLFYGKAENASPRSRNHPPKYNTGEYTGAVVQNVDFSDVKRMSDSVRYYCCAWCGEKNRATIPGGCEGIPNKLENGD